MSRLRTGNAPDFFFFFFFFLFRRTAHGPTPIAAWNTTPPFPPKGFSFLFLPPKPGPSTPISGIICLELPLLAHAVVLREGPPPPPFLKGPRRRLERSRPSDFFSLSLPFGLPGKEKQSLSLLLPSPPCKFPVL